jgi:hypothetical protein
MMMFFLELGSRLGLFKNGYWKSFLQRIVIPKVVA